MKTKIKILIVALLAAVSFTAARADSAGEKKISDAIRKIRSAPSIKASFIMTENGNKVDGDILASGNCFRLNAYGGGYQTWYDGKTQWTWSTMTKEVNITEPTAAELMETNPLSIISTATKTYNVSVVAADASTTTLKLVPRQPKSNTVKEAELKLSNSTNFPVSLKVTFKDRRVVTFTFSNISVGAAVGASEFKYKSSYHPESQIIDLR